MGSDQTKAIVSGGLTGSFIVIGTAFRLAFPDIIVPFEWAITLLIAGLAGLVSTAVFGVRDYLIKRVPKQPQLQAYLSTEIRETHVQLWLEIKNLGPGDVQIESYEISSGDGFKASVHVDLLTFLPEAGSVAIDPHPLFKPDIGHVVRLRMNFSAHNGSGSGTSEYTFSMSDKEISSSPPSSWVQRDGHDVTQEASTQNTAKLFLHPEGTVALVLPKLKKDGTPNILEIESDNRKFYFDPKRLVAILETHSEITTRRVTAQLPRSEGTNSYLIFLRWSDADQQMAIDVSQKSDMKEFSDCQTITQIIRSSLKPTLTLGAPRL